MSCKNIAKKFLFVTILFLFCLYVAGCGLVSSNSFNSYGGDTRGVDGKAEFSQEYQKPRVSGTISSAEITESSGLAASRCNENVLWTHNDSGDGAYIYALDAAGKKLGTWKVSGAKNDDWEDMTTFKTPDGECFLFLGDIGNNARDRGEFIIYRVREPAVAAGGGSSRKNPLSTEPAHVIKFEYPDMRHDAETLMIHPRTGDIYILSKRISGASGVYKLPAAAADNRSGKATRLEKIADFSAPAMPNGLLTGGDISPDGTRAVICDYFGGYEIVLPGDLKNFDEIWKEKPVIVELGERRQGETIAYSADGKSILATSEKKNSPVIRVDRK